MCGPRHHRFTAIRDRMKPSSTMHRRCRCCLLCGRTCRRRFVAARIFLHAVEVAGVVILGIAAPSRRRHRRHRLHVVILAATAIGIDATVGSACTVIHFGVLPSSSSSPRSGLSSSWSCRCLRSLGPGLRQPRLERHDARRLPDDRRAGDRRPRQRGSAVCRLERCVSCLGLGGIALGVHHLYAGSRRKEEHLLDQGCAQVAGSHLANIAMRFVRTSRSVARWAWRCP